MLEHKKLRGHRALANFAQAQQPSGRDLKPGRLAAPVCLGKSRVIESRGHGLLAITLIFFAESNQLLRDRSK
ncbi:hypothetical protein [Xanthomonas translucens]|uniref:hypothetical protein n=1 Tax=Xanthomonas campestris pv. translucens TaxID=343 RepID=UPI000A938CE8|nr:hypothetical protein [Xanthomonas translucens]